MIVGLLTCSHGLLATRAGPARMALDDRRSVLVGGAAGLAGLWLPQAATAKDVVKANPAPAGVTVGIFEHGTPSYTKWRKVLDGFIDPETGQVALPPDQKTIRIIYAKVPKGENAEEGVLACQVFLDDGLPGVQKFFNQDKAKGGPGGDGEPWKGGRAAGWLVDPWHANYYQPRLFRGVKDGPPPPLKKGMGIIYGGHGLSNGQTFDSWTAGFTSKEADEFHASCGIFASVAGPSLAKVSTDVKNKVGVGVVHFTKSAKDTQKFLDTFDPLWQGALKDKIVEGPLRLSVGEVMEDFIYPGDPNYVEPKKKGAKKA